MHNVNVNIPYKIGDEVWRIYESYVMKGIITKIHMKFVHNSEVPAFLYYTVETRDAEFVYTNKLEEHHIYATKEDIIEHLDRHAS